MEAPQAAVRDREDIAAMVWDARSRTLSVCADLEEAKLTVPLLPIVNPFLWEMGHVAWFQERFILRRGGEASLRPEADALYDSSAIPHNTRWSLPLPTRGDTLRYMDTVLQEVLERLERDPDPFDAYPYWLATMHEDMHGEAFLYMRQTLGYPAPAGLGNDPPQAAGPCPGDAEVPGGTFLLGAPKTAPFVFDNEKWAHPVDISPFAIARAPVTNAEFVAFVEDGGYRRPELWSPAGWRWVEAAGAQHPAYWLQEGDRWLVRVFDRFTALAPHHPVIHVNWYEANAWCCWAGRRLPSEAEWELAASRVGDGKHRYPWGNDPAGPYRANLDARKAGPADVGAMAEGDSPWGCRQMIGNVWEWTGSTFTPYPGFSPDAYRDYSAPWFDTRKVLRGGAWATRSRLVSNRYRNFFTPERNDIFAGFRTCAL